MILYVKLWYAVGKIRRLEIKTDSPTISKTSERLLLAASKGYKLQSLDFKTAFLQGKSLEREVIFVPPNNLVKYENFKIISWRLNKSMYGLVDDARNFNRESGVHLTKQCIFILMAQKLFEYSC